MLKLTKRTEYGLIALVHLADRAAEAAPGATVDVVSARAIGDQFPVPRRLLAEALKALQVAGLLESTRGAQGGLPPRAAGGGHLARADVVSILEGAPTVTSCAGLGAAVERRPRARSSPCAPSAPPSHGYAPGSGRSSKGVSLQALADRTVDPADLFSATG